MKISNKEIIKVTLSLSFNFPHKLSQTSRRVCSLCKALMNYISAQIEWSRTKISKILQSGWILHKLLGPLMKVGLQIMENVLTPLAKNVLTPLGLTAATLAEAAGGAEALKKIISSGTATFIISNERTIDIIKTTMSFEDWFIDRRSYLNNWK